MKDKDHNEAVRVGFEILDELTSIVKGALGRARKKKKKTKLK